MRYASFCSGIEAMSVAVADMGWEPAFFSEIEKRPCELLAHHYPNVPNMGDMTKITYKDGVVSNGEKSVNVGTIDVVAGGTPCQDVSTAGKRAGMAEGSGTRSSLAFHFVRLLDEIRPAWFVWENVPGVLSSNGGSDFRELVCAFERVGYSVAWRILDCQFTRVDKFPYAIPQRRRRVWLVGHLGDDWRPSAEILFEPESLRGNTPPSRDPGKGIAPGTEVGPEEPGGEHEGTFDRRETIGTLSTDFEKGATVQQASSGQFVKATTSNGSDVSPTIDASMSKKVNSQMDARGGMSG